jgi:two-component system nitrogen regulation sensor histidine kinase NtrY
MSRQNGIIAFAVATLLLSGLLLIYVQQLDPAAAQAEAAEVQLQANEAQALRWLEQDSLWLEQCRQPFSHPANRPLPNGFSFMCYEGKKRVFWTDSHIYFPDPLQKPQALRFPGRAPQYFIPRELPGPYSVTVGIPLPTVVNDEWSTSPYPVHNTVGTVIGYVPDQVQHLPPFWQKVHLAAGLLFSLALFFLVDKGSRLLSRRLSPTPAFLTAVLVGALWLWMTGILAQFTLLPLHLFWLLSLGQRLPVKIGLHDRHPWQNGALAALGFGSIVTGLLFGGALFRALLLETDLDFDFSNVLMLGTAELIALAAIVLLMLTFLLFSLWTVKGIHRLPLDRNQRLLAMGIAILPGITIALFLNLGLGLLPVLLLPLLYIAMLDLFVEIEAASPAWLMLWLALLSGFAAGLLFKYNLDNGHEQRLAFAKQLTAPDDQMAEQALLELQVQLAAWPPADSLETLLLYTPYLYKNFNWHLLPESDIRHLQTAGTAFRLAPNRHYYTYSLPWRQDSALVFQPALQPNRRVLQELVPSAPHQQARYAISLFKDSVRIAQRGYFLREWLSADLWPVKGESRERLNSKRANLYYAHPDGYTIIVGEALGGYLKPISLFSYLFALLTVLSLLVFGLNRLYPILPATPGSLLFGTPSLRHRIQLSVIGLTLFAFLFIGAVTVASLQQSSVSYHGERLLEKVDVLLRDLQKQDFDPYDQHALRELSEIHQVDLSVYDAGGSLIRTSVPFFLFQGWQSPRINPEAVRAYYRQGFKPALLEEQAGALRYLSAYVPVAEPKQGLSYFFQIPFTSGTRNLQQNVLGFIGNLLNLYVFLLLIAGAIAITVANSITRPLMKIGEKLRSFQLGQNEPLEWESEDEIGKLVNEYNLMIQKLEESAEKLRQSEREGAWREMAKQVAHEIKNPLTPMKLSIQYLEHARKSDPERAAAMISSVAQTLIEQIDGLARIATEFSNFAKMPKAEPESLNLNTVVESVYRLFTEHQEPVERIELTLPDTPVPVFADRGHLVRVLNNLIKNAQQAIPEDRQGHIHIRVQPGAAQHLITVTDNGTGIPEEVQPKVFQPNFTTKSSGMGLGLAMCKNMMTATGGDIYFETEPGKGTTFFMALPDASAAN